jgi:SAM-dependent methyltransferase
VGRAIVESLPCAAGRIDAGAADARLLEAHVELQRLSEEFDHGRRVAELVTPIVRAARLTGGPWAMRMTDVGCGIAYVPRYLAFHRSLGDGVALAGRDFNPGLVAEARALAAAEGLDVDLAVGDALTEGEAPGIAISTGFLHHLSGDDLRSFFARQRAAAWAFAHFDFQPSALAPFGAWLFHQARFRSALARHDGVLSALRAHTGPALLDAAADPAGVWSIAMFGERFGPFPRVFHALVGVRRELVAPFVEALGPRRERLGSWRH